MRNKTLNGIYDEHVFFLHNQQNSVVTLMIEKFLDYHFLSFV